MDLFGEAGGDLHLSITDEGGTGPQGQQQQPGREAQQDQQIGDRQQGRQQRLTAVLDLQPHR
ncbi:MAG: hypothetical protein KGQ81_04400, partial [Cyanobacteria bacterium REEB498]|nr:hypothetical protein [Cyanobacteria bacterium REEB498]